MHENRRATETSDLARKHVKELESMISSLRDEIESKNQMLDDFERNLNDSRTYSDRMTMNNQSLISA
jgi:hypothetical protein